MKIVLVIRSLEYGGTERQAVALANGLAVRGHSVAVAVFYRGGELARELDGTNVCVIYLDKRGRWDALGFGLRLLRALRREKPDVICGFLPSANIASVLIKPMCVGVPVVWRLGASFLDLSKYDRFSRAGQWIEARLSRFADLVISNSKAGIQYAVDRGFPEKKLLFVPNGIDINRFRQNKDGGERFRKELGIGAGETVIGLVARLDPIKGHPVFLEAVGKLPERFKNVRFVCVGDGPDEYRKELAAKARELGIDGRLIWAGARNNMEEVYNAFDVLTLTSYSEGFPNVVGEAMACGTPCVVTDVGDCAEIVGDTGVTVPARAPAELAKGWMKMLERVEKGGAELGKTVRKFVAESYSMDRLVDRTEAALLAVTGGKR